MEEEHKEQTNDVPQRDIESQRPTSVAVNGKRMLHEPDESYDVKMCCGPTTSCDKGLLEFIAKTMVSGSVLTFCFVSLLNGLGDSAFLSSTISLILGTYLGGQISPPTKDKKD